MLDNVKLDVNDAGSKILTKISFENVLDAYDTSVSL